MWKALPDVCLSDLPRTSQRDQWLKKELDSKQKGNTPLALVCETFRGELAVYLRTAPFRPELPSYQKLMGLEQGFQVLGLEQALMLHSAHSRGSVFSCLLGIQYSVLGFKKKKVTEFSDQTGSCPPSSFGEWCDSVGCVRAPNSETGEGMELLSALRVLLLKLLHCWGLTGMAKGEMTEISVGRKSRKNLD